ncbi:hypothetical protein E2C01_014998 [Portunus trituberculatus]|uniref:Uncharacterized protein n=1 Tax=Portunus trituberculatus TaxID=210409 RepID=A0A5B7DLS6_PORTR|nr:hypothetical protein [Portunus trituberculatus]
MSRLHPLFKTKLVLLFHSTAPHRAVPPACIKGHQAVDGDSPTEEVFAIHDFFTRDEAYLTSAE